MKFEKVLSGIIKFINNEIYSNMTNWQEMLARTAVSRVIGNAENIKKLLIENPFLKTFAIIDDEGNVDFEGLIKDIKTQFEQKHSISFSIPIFGKFTFDTSDVDKLYHAVTEGDYENN